MWCTRSKSQHGEVSVLVQCWLKGTVLFKVQKKMYSSFVIGKRWNLQNWNKALGQSLGKDTILDPTHVWSFLLDWLRKSVHKLFSPSFHHLLKHYLTTTEWRQCSQTSWSHRFLTIRYSEISFIGSWVYSFRTSYQCWTLANLRPHTSSSSVILQEYRITAWLLINIKFRTSAGFLLQTGVFAEFQLVP